MWVGLGDGRRDDRQAETEGGPRKAAATQNAWSRGPPPASGPQKPIILKRKVEEETPVSHAM